MSCAKDVLLSLPLPLPLPPPFPTPTPPPPPPPSPQPAFIANEVDKSECRARVSMSGNRMGRVAFHLFSVKNGGKQVNLV